MSDLILHLRSEEQKVFEDLSEDIRDGWKVEKEELESFERPEELKMRSLMLSVQDEIKPLLEELQNSESMEDARAVLSSLDSLPKSAVLEIFFSIGARGLSVLIHALLSSVRSDEDLGGVAELSQIRHALLESNAEVSSSV